MRGECRRGAECAYTHEMPPATTPPHQNIEHRFHGIYEPVALKHPDRLETVSPQEIRERVMKRKKGSTPPPGFSAISLGLGSAAVGESSEETRFITSFPWDFLAEKSGVTKLWPDADALLLPAPMHLLEKKSDIELVSKATELSLQGVQVALMTRRRLVAQLGQQDVWRARLAEAEAAKTRMSSQLMEAAAEIRSLKEAAAEAEARAEAAEARAAAIEAREAATVAEEARKAREALLMTVDAQFQEMREKIRVPLTLSLNHVQAQCNET